LPNSVRTLPEPPLYPSPEIFNRIHLGVKLGQEMAHHPWCGCDKL
jgi:hypothetical protein